MKRSIALEGLSKHRTALMGIAIICVMLCHNTLIVPELLINIWKTLTVMLQCGVDIFLLLSGLGLYYSFRKQPEKRKFWIKRFTKILPPYLVCVAFVGVVFVVLLKELSLANYIWGYSLISFYLDAKLTVWFIAVIVLLYAVFPYLYAVLQKFPRFFGFAVAGCGIICLVLSYMDCPRAISGVNTIFLSRLPAFLSGMLIAKAILDGKNPKVPDILAWLVWSASAALLILAVNAPKGVLWTIVRLLFLPFSLSGLLLLLKPLDKCKHGGYPYKAFYFLGGLTLEIYLMHQHIGNLLDRLWININFSHTILAFVTNILAIVIAILMALAIQRGISGVTNFLKAKKR